MSIPILLNLMQENGISEGLWQKIPFIEEVLNYKDKNESMDAFVFRYLNERAHMTTEGILGRELIQKRIETIREHLAIKFKG
jgi:hypothetical protein